MSFGGTIKNYTDLVAWQKGYALVLTVYRQTTDFPSDERFGLTQQVRRAAVSIPSNIAEGWGRGTTADYLRFLRNARGSAYELQTQLMLACDLGFSSDTDATLEAVAEVCRILNGLIRSIH